jgi:glycosyltransferase involved in cell wall biosynthesis
MGDAFDDPRRSIVWMDVTTSWRSRGGRMNGTLRIEQNYAPALAQIMPERLRLCRYRRSRQRFVPLTTLPQIAATGASAREKKSAAGSAPQIGKRIERAVRQWRRSAAAHLFEFADSVRGGTNPFPEARPGDVLLLAGETWSQYDFATLRRARQQGGIRIAAICQDLIPAKLPQFFEADGFVERFARYADFLVADVDLVIAISEQTKRDILEYGRSRGTLRADVQTVSLGHDLSMPTPSARPPVLAGLEPRKFVLSVSSIQSRKNFDLIYHVWRRLCEEGLQNLPKLVIAGRAGFGGGDLLWQIAHDPMVRDRVIVRHDISDAALSWLYRECAFTLYPSFYEGWGLPVSESLAYGKFCIASNAPALVEAGQRLAQHIDPLDFAAWRDAVAELVRSPELLAGHERRIKAEYRPVNWRQSAEQLAALLQPLYSEPRA